MTNMLCLNTISKKTQYGSKLLFTSTRVPCFYMRSRYATGKHIKHHSHNHKNSSRSSETPIGYSALDASKNAYELRFSIEKMIKDYASQQLLPISEIWQTYSCQYFNNATGAGAASVDSSGGNDLRKHLSNQQIYALNLQTINLLLIYTCKRIAAFGQLPYIAVINPKIEENNRLYYQTLQELLMMLDSVTKYIDTDDHKYMVDTLASFIDAHNDSLVPLSIGLQQVVENNWLMKDSMSDFLNSHLRDRIVMKTIASHHLEILKQNDNSVRKADSTGVPCRNSDMIGIIHPSMKISTLVSQVQEFVSDLCFVKYDQQVPVKIKYGQDIEFPCVPTDLEYVMTEILKNSSRAHIESNKADVPIEITIVKTNKTCTVNADAASVNTSTSSSRSSSNTSGQKKKYFQELEIRIRDFGGGIPPLVEDKILDYSFSTVTKEAKDNGMGANVLPGEQVNNVSGMGFGLPLCKAYLDICDGELDIQSLYGYGTDVYIKLQSTFH